MATRLRTLLSQKRNKYWWTMIGRVVSTMLLQSSYPEETRERFDGFFKTSVAPLLGPSPEESTLPVSMCDNGTPVEIGWVFKPTDETSVQYAIEALSPTDGSNKASTSFKISLSPMSVRTSICLGLANAPSRSPAYQNSCRKISNRFLSSSSVSIPHFRSQIVIVPYILYQASTSRVQIWI